MERYVAIYLRVSTEDQAKNGYGLGDQEVQCRKYIDLYYPEKEIIIYKDDGYSGKNLKRPKVQELLKDVDDGKIEAIVIFKLDRISRSVVDTYNLIDRIVKNDCALIAVLDRLDITSANGRMFVGMLSLISQWEREVIQERTIAGMNEMAREGKYPMGTPPFGWKKTEDNFLYVDEEEAVIVNQMADWYIEGFSLDEIKRKAKAKYNIVRSTDVIKKILQRSCNIGKLKFHDTVYTNIVPPIMDTKKYKKLQGILDLRKKNVAERTHYIFHSLCYCDVCGTQLEQVSTNKPKGDMIYYYYYCPKCDRRCNQVIIERQVFASILLHNKKLDTRQRKKEIKEQLKKIKQKEDELFESYTVDESNKEQYINMSRRFYKKKGQLQQELSCFRIKTDKQYKKSTFDEKYYLIHHVVSKLLIDLQHKIVVRIEYKDE